MVSKPSSSKLTTEGRRILTVLMTQYGMSQDNAIRLMQNGGIALATATPVQPSEPKKRVKQTKCPICGWLPLANNRVSYEQR